MTDYRSMFDRNSKTGAYLIEVNLENYIDFYHEWDSAKFKKRDIHPELSGFLLECTEEIHRREKIEVAFSVEAGETHPEQEDMIRSSFAQYFRITLGSSGRSLFRLVRNVVISILAAILFLVTAELSPSFLGSGLFSTILTEGFYVGGWVFLWEAVYTVAFVLPEKNHDRRLYKRLLHADLSFTYTNMK